MILTVGGIARDLAFFDQILSWTKIMIIYIPQVKSRLGTSPRNIIEQPLTHPECGEKVINE